MGIDRRHLARAAADGHDPFVLVLEHLQDPTNFGTLLRSAEAAGVDGVVFPERGAAPLSAAAVKASAGASEHLLLARLPTIGEAIHELKAAGLRLVAADQEAPASAWESDLTGPIAVVVGSEGSGLSGADEASLRPARQLPDGRARREPERRDRRRAAAVRGRPPAPPSQGTVATTPPETVGANPEEADAGYMSLMAGRASVLVLKPTVVGSDSRQRPRPVGSIGWGRDDPRPPHRRGRPPRPEPPHPGGGTGRPR